MPASKHPERKTAPPTRNPEGRAEAGRSAALYYDRLIETRSRAIWRSAMDRRGAETVGQLVAELNRR